MAIVGAFDVHRRQVTFDVLDTVSGQVRRGQMRPACRATLRQFLGRFAGQDEVSFAVEGCTGWRFIVEELEGAGFGAHVADPAAVADARGSKRRAKTDRIDSRARLAAGEGLSPAARQSVGVAVRVADVLQTELDELGKELGRFARRQPGCRALAAQYGVGPITAVAIWAFMGDTRRFSSSAQAVRHTGLDVTVYSSDGKRSPGHLSRQGPPVLRWALYEAACSAARATSPDLDYYH